MQGSLINGPGWQAERVMVMATACQTIGTLARKDISGWAWRAQPVNSAFLSCRLTVIAARFLPQFVSNESGKGWLKRFL
ncbi:hypothetical protein CR62_12150 [Serratia grimesii]|uniref:Uncharacterized protein n=1 Tax=Serratia grimesii TaxID=82995 RepID=A0ABR4U640_9GAMM|nr:hypothetical protein CR62_12150 [Serratia grimesii]